MNNNLNRSCTSCVHCKQYGMHAVKIQCDITGKIFYPYISEEYKNMIEEYKKCENFELLPFLKNNK